MDNRPRILIVDADPQSLRVTSRLLRQAGYQILEATSGEQCLRLAVEHRPELMLVGVLLPDVDGIEFCRRLKADPALDGSLVVLHSATKTSSEDQALGLECGADGYIVQPIPNREFLARVETFLRLQRALAERDAAGTALQAANDRLAAHIVERRSAEQALRDSEERLRAILEHAGVGIIVIQDGKQVFYNARMYEMVGYTEDEYANRDFVSLIHPEDREFVASRIRQRLAGADLGASPRRIRILAKSGEIRWIETNSLGIQWEGRPAVQAFVLDCTDRKRAEEALRESENRYRAVSALTSDHAYAYRVEPDGEIVNEWVTGALARVTGYSPQEIKSAGGWEHLLHPDDRTVALDQLRALLSNEAKTVEYRIVAKDGQVRWMRDYARPTWSATEGRVTRIEGAVQDITERKQAEEALRESDERYRSFVHGFQGIAFRGKMDFTPIFFHGAAEKLTGYTEREFLEGKPRWDQVIHPDDLPTLFAADEGRLHSIPDYSFEREYRIVRKDGAIRWVHEIIQNVCDDSGKPVMLQGAIYDITERVWAERATLERQRYLESVLSAAPDAIVTLDPQNRIVDWNSGAERLFGHRREKVIGRDLDSLVARGDRLEEEAAIFTRLLSGGGTLPPTETIRHRRDGSPVNVVVAGAPIVMDDEVAGVVVMYTDITKRKLTEEALRQRALQMALLSEIGQQVTAFLDLDQVLDRAAQLVQERFGYHHVGLFTRAEGEEWLVMRARAGEFAPLFPPEHAVTPGHGMVGWVALHGETLLANDVSAEPLYANYYPDRLLTRSELSVPIRIGDEIVGVLDLQSPQTGAFGRSDVTTLETLAGQIAVAIHNARLFETERAARQQAEKLQAATQALSATLDLQQVLERILTELRHVVPYDSASVQQLKENSLKIIGGHGFPNLEELLGEEFDLVAQDNPNREVVRTKAVLILEDAAAQFEAFRREPHAPAGIRAWLGVPLFFGDRLIGIIALDKKEPGYYTEEHARLAQAFAAQAATAIENARLFHEAQRRNRELTLLNRVIAATAVAGEALEPTLEIICQELALAFEVPRASASLFDEEKTEVVVVAEYLAHGRASSLGERFPVAGSPALQNFLTRKAPLLIEDTPADPSQAPIYDLMRQGGTQSLLLLPLMVDGEVVGSLSINAIEPQAFSTEEVNLAWRVAEQVSSVLARARLGEERRQLEDQFHQAQKMEAVGQLAGGVAHDFNNLLTVIHLSARLLERSLYPEDPLWTHVQRIQDAGERASNLTRQLLAFSRRDMVELKVLSLNQVLGELEMMLQRLISEDIEMATRLADDLWPVEIDPTQVEQVVVNLAVNAGDAMPGGGKLTIRTANVLLDEAYAAQHLEVEPGEYVMLAVSDTGVGMDEETKSRLFEPFFTTKERGKGTGLGLATVFGIVKQNRGHIGVYSQLDRGTTFEVYLPRAKGVLAPPQKPSAYLEPSAPGSETLLVAEDQTQVRELMRDILVAQGYRVLTAEDGVEALQVAQHHQGPIHLLISDVVMPRMSGRALADQLRSIRPDMRVLFTSGYTDDAILRHGVLEKDTDFLAKPFELETLTRRVRAVLDAKS